MILGFKSQEDLCPVERQDELRDLVVTKPDPADMMTWPEDRVIAYLAETDQPYWLALERNTLFDHRWVAYFLKRKRFIAAEKVREIYRSRTLRSSYVVNKALVHCKFTPPGIAANILPLLRWVDLLLALREPYLHGSLRPRIERQIMERFPQMPLGERITLAKQAPRGLIRQIRLSPDRRVIRALMKNYFFTYEDAVFLANYPKIKSDILSELAMSGKWMHHKQLRLDLLANPRLPMSAIQALMRGFTPHDIHQLLKKPGIRPVIRNKLKQMMAKEGKFP